MGLGCWGYCGFNWYDSRHDPTHWDHASYHQYCDCCGGTQAQQDTCKSVCLRVAAEPEERWFIEPDAELWAQRPEYRGGGVNWLNYAMFARNGPLGTWNDYDGPGGSF